MANLAIQDFNLVATIDPQSPAAPGKVTGVVVRAVVEMPEMPRLTPTHPQRIMVRRDLLGRVWTSCMVVLAPNARQNAHWGQNLRKTVS